MKTSLFSLSLFLTSAFCSAQSNWSVGLRTGAELAKTTSLNKESINPLFQQQLFISRRLFKQFELEVNVAYKGPIKTSSVSTGGLIGDGPEYWSEASTTISMDFGIPIRYFILQKDNWSSFLMAGINASNSFTKSNTYSSAYFSWSGPIQEKYNLLNYSEFNLLNEIYFGAGFNKNIASNWKLNAQVSMNYNLNGSMNFYYLTNNFSPKLQIGLAYCW
jgi:hypothetical protein